jgi:hypothetical protein
VSGTVLRTSLAIEKVLTTLQARHRHSPDGAAGRSSLNFPNDVGLPPSEVVVKARDEVRHAGVVWHWQAKGRSCSPFERIEVRGGFQNNPKNLFVFRLFQADGIGALASHHSPHPAKRGEGEFLLTSQFRQLQFLERGGCK